VLLALEMSLFARELSKAGHSARSSRLDGCAGGARSLEDRILAAAFAAQTAMNMEVVFRKITAALNQAGIQLHAGWIICQHLLGAARSTQNIDLMIRAIPAQLRICSESAQREILCRLGCPGKLSCGVHFEFSFIAHGGGAAFCDYSLDDGLDKQAVEGHSGALCST